MRLWSLHPHYLDAKGLVALWREGLLAQKVLLGETIGYKNHPQLVRFKNTDNYLGAIASYLRHVETEAASRGYRFERNKIIGKRFNRRLTVTKGQLEYEFNLLLAKLRQRDYHRYLALKSVTRLKPHPLFQVTTGAIADWEVVDNLQHQD